MSWQLQFTRKYSLLRWVEYLESLNHPVLFDIPKIGRVKLIVDGFQAPQQVYFDPSEWNKKLSQPLLNYCLHFKNWKSFSRNYLRSAVNLYSFITKLKKCHLENLSNFKLAKVIFESKRSCLPNFALGVWGIWIVEPLLTDKEFLSERFKGLSVEDITAIITPPRLAAHFQEEIALRKLNLNNEIAVKKHLDKFQWIPCVDLLDKPWDIKDLIKRKKEIIKQRPTIDQDQRKKLLNRYNILIRKLPFNQRQLAKIIHQIVYLKDYRNDVRFYATFYIAKIYQEAARRLKISTQDIIFLTDEEIIIALKSGNINPQTKNKIRQRSNGYWIKKDYDKINISTNRRTFLRQDISSIDLKNVAPEITGIIAMSGKARGEVAIIRTDTDLRKVKTNSIIVAVFTRPHYLGAMRKARAFVTDEGGLTCHAAIVSRELKKPCIVGTKIATKVLKDGDLVEVDANKGIVRIIKK